MFLSASLLVALVSLSSGAIVTWLPSVGFDSPRNFEGGVLPCSKQTVVFPENIQGSVLIEDGTSVNELILPLNGELVLSQGTIYFGEDTNEKNCEKGTTHFIDKTLASWAQPDVWTSTKFNKATPDSERLPCFDDTVEFPINSTFLIELPDRTQLVSKLKLHGEYYDTLGFARNVLFSGRNPSQAFVMNKNMPNFEIVILTKSCQSISGCSCQKAPLKVDCSLKYCAVPTCEYSVKPKGHCCHICGGELIFPIAITFNMRVFKELVKTTVEKYGSNKLSYHVGRLVDDRIQLIIVDTDDYEGVSTEVVNAIRHLMPGDWVTGLTAKYSGGPLYKSGMGGKIFISMFFVVASIMAVIYLYYYKLPNVNMQMLDRGRGLTTRFQRRTDSVVSLTRRDSVNIGQARTAFRNPLYDSKRGRVEVEETTDN